MFSMSFFFYAYSSPSVLSACMGEGRVMRKWNSGGLDKSCQIHLILLQEHQTYCTHSQWMVYEMVDILRDLRLVERQGKKVRIRLLSTADLNGMSLLSAELISHEKRLILSENLRYNENITHNRSRM